MKKAVLFVMAVGLLAAQTGPSKKEEPVECSRVGAHPCECAGMNDQVPEGDEDVTCLTSCKKKGSQCCCPLKKKKFSKKVMDFLTILAKV